MSLPGDLAERAERAFHSENSGNSSLCNKIIEELLQTRSLQAIPLLTRALKLVAVPERHQIQWENRSEALAGPVSNSAARAIVGISLGSSDVMLRKMFLDQEVDTFERESLVYAIGEHDSEKSYELLELALTDSDPLVRLAAAHMISNKVMKSPSLASRYVEALIRMILVFAPKRDIPFEDPSVIGRRLLKVHLSPGDCGKLALVIQEEEREMAQRLLAIDILEERGSTEARFSLASILGVKGLSPVIYERIGQKLERCQERGVIKLVSELPTGAGLKESFLRLFKSDERQSEQAREDAIYRILEGKR